MRASFIFLLFVFLLQLSAQEPAGSGFGAIPNSSVPAATPIKEDPQMVALRAEVESLKAQLAEKDVLLSISDQVCHVPSLLSARLKVAEAATAHQKALEASQKAAKKNDTSTQ